MKNIFTKQNMKKYTKEIVTTVILIIVISNVLSFLRSPSLDSQQLPMMKEQTLNGEVFNSDEYKEKELMIHLWATWCKVCKAESPNIDYISDNYNVITIAINSGNDQNIKKYMRDNNLHFKVINDKDSTYSKLFKVQAYPTTYIYSHGKLKHSDVGYSSTLSMYIKMFFAK